MIDSHLTILTCTHTLPLHGLTDFSVLPSSSVAKGGVLRFLSKKR